MAALLPAPEVLDCYFETGFQPSLPAMLLRWPPDSSAARPRRWLLPEGVVLTGPAPDRFGLDVRRLGGDCYAVRLLWNRTGLTWPGASRADLLTGDLKPLLLALGTDLWYLLEQPVPSGTAPRARAA